jgi:hypothetical protein
MMLYQMKVFFVSIDRKTYNEQAKQVKKKFCATE